MREALLHYLWQYQQFDKGDLKTTRGELVALVRTGFLNADAGPDFCEAQLRIGTLDWAGQVEIHVRASEWYAHQHQHDAAYDGVILHVVWENDREVVRRDGTPLPTLVLSGRVPVALLDRYTQLMEALTPLPCAAHFRGVDSLRKSAMLDKALLQRLERKALEVKQFHAESRGDWEETTYWLLARNLGFKVNADPMLRLARALPLKILRKHRHRPEQVEALIFGMAGLLTVDYGESEPELLRREWDYLAHKYGLADQQLSAHVWKFSRLRPANFPTLRLAQLAALVVHVPAWFALMTETEDLTLLKQQLVAPVRPYWHHHYRFGQTTHHAPPAAMGESSRDNLLVNTVAPLLAAVSKAEDRPALIDRAVALLETLPPEDNRITRHWNDFGLPLKTAAGAQGSLEWFQAWCQPKGCLRCAVGLAIVKGSSHP